MEYNFKTDLEETGYEDVIWITPSQYGVKGECSCEYNNEILSSIKCGAFHEYQILKEKRAFGIIWHSCRMSRIAELFCMSWKTRNNTLIISCN